MKKSLAYRKAMNYLAENQAAYKDDYNLQCGCCAAIAGAWPASSVPLNNFRWLFADRGYQIYWWGGIEEGYTARIIALELAALIAEEEGG